LEQIFGIILHSIGGFSSASFYVPSHLVKKWAWQTYWITLGFVAWIVMPTVGALLTTPDIMEILRESPKNSMIWTYIFGVLWGFGGLGAGLGLRYLGLSLGQSISLGVCAIVGTVVPAIMDHKIYMLVSTVPGGIILLGFILCLAGIVFCGYAGVLKDSMLTDDQKKESVKEFSAVKGLSFAVLGGIMSGCMAIAIKFGGPISNEAVNSGTAKVFMVLPIYILALGGGFTTNFVYTVIFSIRNKSFGDYSMRPKTTLFRNYFMALLSGLMWYGQFFFYGMGHFDFASWSIHMASIIIFSNLWGLWLKEWNLVSRKTIAWLLTGILMLVVSVILIGIGNYMAGIG
jgi:L-rhamnose-H+ transport protein